MADAEESAGAVPVPVVPAPLAPKGLVAPDDDTAPVEGAVADGVEANDDVGGAPPLVLADDAGAGGAGAVAVAGWTPETGPLAVVPLFATCAGPEDADPNAAPPEVTGRTLVAPPGDAPELIAPPEAAVEVEGAGEAVASDDPPDVTRAPPETGMEPDTGIVARADVGDAEADELDAVGERAAETAAEDVGAVADPLEKPDLGGVAPAPALAPPLVTVPDLDELEVDCWSVDGRGGVGVPFMPDDAPPDGGVEEEDVEIGFWVMRAVPTARLGLDV